MPEMQHAGEHHGEAGLVSGSDHFLVAHRPARLDHRRRVGHVTSGDIAEPGFRTTDNPAMVTVLCKMRMQRLRSRRLQEA